MQIRTIHLAGLALLLLPHAALGASARKPYAEDEDSTRSHSWFLRAAKDTPAGQLAWADELAEHGNRRRSDRAYRALVNRWPRAPEAVVAQHHHARILQERGKLKDAFDAYQKLVDDYPGQFQYEEVLEAQFAIAKATIQKRHGKFLFLPGFRAPERALDMLGQVVKNGPRSAFAPEAQYLQGQIREQGIEYELAVLDYTETLLRYPESEFAEPAAFGRARTLVRLSDESPNDTDAAQEAWYALTLFNTTYPDSEYADEIAEYTRHMYDRLAKGAYDIAVFYDHTARKPEAALTAYESFVSRFPSSQWTEDANQRIHQLKRAVENDREEL